MMDEAAQHTTSILSFAAAFACMTIGAYMHYREVCKSGRHRGSLKDYLLADSPDRSGIVLLLLLLASWQATSSGAADNINPELLWALLKAGHFHDPTINTLIALVGLGYTFDSKFNRGGTA